MFLRFERTMTTDVHLALWVTVANAVILRMLFAPRPVTRRAAWSGCIAAGLAVGLALMSKGPVALAQTIIPLGLAATWQRWRRRGDRGIPAVPGNPCSRIGRGPLIVAAAVALLVALPWPIYVMSRMSGQVLFWYHEISRVSAIDDPADPPWVYLSLLVVLMPWTGLFLLGVAGECRKRLVDERGLMLVALVFVPIIIMLFFADKNDRYLMPMFAPAAVIAAVALAPAERTRDRDARAARWRGWMIAFTFAAVVVMTLGLAIAGATRMVQRANGDAGWWSWRLAAAVCAGGLVLIGAAWRIDRLGRRTLVPVAVIMMLSVQALSTWGYAQTARGRSDGKPLADVIVAALPADAQVWHYAPPDRFQKSPVDTSIYLNRTVTRIEDLKAIRGGDKPAAVIVHCREGQPMPPEMASWREIGTAEKNRGIWHVCVTP
jgi:4-amino-4-deoxy-L-arabinose transferase-like glycosyltransferase